MYIDKYIHMQQLYMNVFIHALPPNDHFQWTFLAEDMAEKLSFLAKFWRPLTLTFDL